MAEMIDPRRILGALDGAVIPMGVQQQEPLPLRVFFHSKASIGWYGPEGLPAGVQITNNDTGEPIVPIVIALDVTEEDGRHAKHITYFDEAGIGRMFDLVIPLLSDEAFEILRERVAGGKGERVT
jgi:hypothetical protein